MHIPMTKDDLEADGARIAKRILRFDALMNPEHRKVREPYPGFFQPVPYAHEPLNRYQAWIRKGASDVVEHQYTRRFGEKTVER